MCHVVHSMDKHRVTMKTALNIVTKILSKSRVGLLGTVKTFGGLVVAQCDHNGAKVTIQVSFQSGLTIDVSGASRGDMTILEGLLESTENAAGALHSTFDLFQVA